jgi:hypothetical protein
MLCGGVPTTPELQKGYFVLPTIFDNVNEEMTIWLVQITIFFFFLKDDFMKCKECSTQ